MLKNFTIEEEKRLYQEFFEEKWIIAHNITRQVLKELRNNKIALCFNYYDYDKNSEIKGFFDNMTKEDYDNYEPDYDKFYNSWFDMVSTGNSFGESHVDVLLSYECFLKQWFKIPNRKNRVLTHKGRGPYKQKQYHFIMRDYCQYDLCITICNKKPYSNIGLFVVYTVVFLA
jgi:hypothetical protein